MKLAVYCVVTLLGVASFAKDKTPLHLTSAEEFKARKAEFDALTPEQKSEFRQKRIAFHKEKAGGVVRDTRGMSGTVYVINAQKNISTEDVKKPVEWLQNYLKVQFKVIDGAYVHRDTAYSFRQKNKANAIIVVYDDPKESASILVAPESRWGSINIAQLGTDNLVERTQKEISRTIAFVCGGISSQYHPTLGSHVDSPSFLDKVDGYDLPVDILLSIRQFLPQLGVRPYRDVMYRKACREGWAPAPTNDVQKAIWNEIHATPKNPMKIEFDPKKGR